MKEPDIKGLAHKIDNPLQVIMNALNYGNLLLQDPRVSMPREINQEFKEIFAKSLTAADRVSSMTEIVLDYVKNINNEKEKP